MLDEKTGWTEPDVTINGTSLTFGQSMALRVAVSTFLMSLSEPDALGDDEAGRGIAAGYKQRLSEIAKLIHKTTT